MNSQARREMLFNTVATVFVMATSPMSVYPARATDKAPVTHIVEITKFEFHPHQLRVRQGDEIIWKNHDIVPHTATAEDQSWNTGPIKKGKTVSVVATKTMEGSYFCRFHPHMKAELAVQDENSN